MYELANEALNTRQIKVLTYHDRKVCNDVSKENAEVYVYLPRNKRDKYPISELAQPLYFPAETYYSLLKSRSSCPEVFCKKGVLRNFAKFTGKQLCQSLFFNKVAGLSFFLQNTSGGCFCKSQLAVQI